MSTARADAINGVLLIDKPSGPSSNAVLQRAKHIMGAKRAGHTGTLDPLASGLLVIGLGEARKFCATLLASNKAYRARVKLGIRTTTGDAEGSVLEAKPVQVSRDALLATLERFRGSITQVPPPHAAIKHRGRPLYEYARRGEPVPRPPRQVEIYELDLKEFMEDTFDIEVECSKGTYIRSLADDIGQALGCGAHLVGLRREAVGPFRLSQAVTIESLEARSLPDRREQLLPPEFLLEALPRVRLDTADATRFGNGQPVHAAVPEGDVAVFDYRARLLGLGRVDTEGRVWPKRLVVDG